MYAESIAITANYHQPDFFNHEQFFFLSLSLLSFKYLDCNPDFCSVIEYSFNTQWKWQMNASLGLWIILQLELHIFRIKWIEIPWKWLLICWKLCEFIGMWANYHIKSGNVWNMSHCSDFNERRSKSNANFRWTSFDPWLSAIMWNDELYTHQSYFKYAKSK